MTDGYDEHSVTSLAQALAALQRLHADHLRRSASAASPAISLKGELLLRQIAKQTGGRAFFPSREEQLPDVHERDRRRTCTRATC